MGFRQYVLEVLKSRAQGRVVQGRYYPPGSLLQRIGDLIASFGALGLFFPLAAFNQGFDYPLLWAGIDTGLNFAIWTLAPFVAGIYVVMCWMMWNWQSRIVLVVIGLIGVFITGEYALDAFGWILFGLDTFPHQKVAWLSLGNAVVTFGGIISASAAIYGEWAKQFDTPS